MKKVSSLTFTFYRNLFDWMLLSFFFFTKRCNCFFFMPLFLRFCYFRELTRLWASKFWKNFTFRRTKFAHWLLLCQYCHTCLGFLFQILDNCYHRLFRIFGFYILCINRIHLVLFFLRIIRIIKIAFLESYFWVIIVIFYCRFTLP